MQYHEPTTSWEYSGNSYTLNTTWQYDSNATSSFPVALIPGPPPIDDSPLAWLRKKVAEVCELATAA